MNLNLVNYDTRLEPESTLFQEEVDVIMAVLEQILATQDRPESGTFLLYGTRDGDSSQHIIACDFGLGATPNYRGQGLNSRQKAIAVLEQDARNSHAGDRSYISYFKDSPLFLSLRAAAGNFGCAFFTNNATYTAMTYVYFAVAKTLSLLSPNDSVLNQSVNDIFTTEVEDHPGIATLEHLIKRLFTEADLPEIQRWKTWHTDARKNGGLTLFFT